MLPSGSDPGDLLASIAESLEAEPDLPHTAEQVLTFAQETLSIDHAGITVINGNGNNGGGTVTTLVSSDPVVEKADELQVELDEGPCRDAAWEQQTLLVSDLATDERWPCWAPQAGALGLGSILAVELTLRGRRFGALNLYCAEPRVFDRDEIAFAHLFGRHAAVALAAARQEDTLTEAIDARTLIGQAQGILMERFGLDADKAFDVLRRYSQDFNTKLRTVAEDLVSSRKLPG
ncbi:MAG TPA: GAF and ANTAR domain-containing protein [Nocardioidaceae bacterium]|nr:GAF and ANTAR domain-containing protein [Nocardioidaceae bacterium]